MKDEMTVVIELDGNQMGYRIVNGASDEKAVYLRVRREGREEERQLPPDGAERVLNHIMALLGITTLATMEML